jgi:hypothetical protein
MAAYHVNVAAAAEAPVKVDTSNALCYGAARTLAVCSAAAKANAKLRDKYQAHQGGGGGCRACGGSWCGFRRSGRTGIGIAACANACVPSFRSPSLVLPVDRWTACCDACPRWGEGGSLPTRPVQAQVP